MKFNLLRNQVTLTMVLVFVIGFGQINFLSALDNPNTMQMKVVQGKVVDSQEKPVPGVNVYIKGTIIGTVTDIQGNYSLEIRQDIPDPVLVFSCIGMTSQEIPIGDQTTINITLAEDVIGLEEVVAIGYGTRSKLTLTGSVTDIKSEEITRKISTNVMSNLQGMLPGVVVTRSDGRPGNEGYSFEIRGVSSINASQPLIIIDGVFSTLEQFTMINPEDIANISVLRDGSAAIYGARAANGVMLITTKKGTGKMTVNYRAKFSMKTPAIIMAKTTTEQEWALRAEAAANDGAMSSPWILQYKDQVVDNTWGALPNGNWLWKGQNSWDKELFGPAPIHTHDLSISGETDLTSYMFSLGYLDESSMIQWGDHRHQRYNMRLNYSYKMTDKLRLSSILSVAQTNLLEPRAVNDGTFNANWNTVFTWYPIYAESYDESGLFYSQSNANPAAAAELGGDHKKDVTDLSVNLKAEYLFGGVLSGLNLTIQGGVNKMLMNSKQYYPLFMTSMGRATEAGNERFRYHPSDKRTSTENSTSRNMNQTYMALLNYEKTFSQRHKVTALAGASHEQQDYMFYRAWRYNLLSNNLYTLNLGATDQQFNTETANAWALQSLFGRLGYSFNDRYFIEGILRHDGSSKFISDNRWRSFYGVSGAWVITNEDFMSNIGFFDLLKLRLSYGESGNQGGIGLYDYVERITIGGTYNFGEVRTNSAYLAGMVSLSRTWETVGVQNIGLDYAILNGRLSGSLDMFKKLNSNMLVEVVYPSILGATAPYSNSGELETKGWELTLQWRDRIGSFSYFIRPQVSDSKNKLIKYEGKDVVGAAIREGYPLNSMYGFEWDGYIQTAEEQAEWKLIGGAPANIRLGDNKYVDQDEDGKISSPNDLVYFGESSIHYDFGILFGFSFKNFDFSSTLQGVGSQLAQITTVPLLLNWNQCAAEVVGNTWTPENTNARLPRLSDGFSAVNFWNYANTSDRTLFNARYIRLKDIQFGYSLDAQNIQILNRIGIGKLRVYLSGTDLWEAHKMPEGFDPERKMTYAGNVFARYLGFGIDVSF